jgi:transcriptional regulator with XRE-family HTH domain
LDFPVKMQRAVAGAAQRQESDETIGQRIRRLRLERGLSQREIAEPGVSYAYISRIESDARKPSLKALRILARKFGVSLEYLETGREVPAHAERSFRLDDAELALRLQGDAVSAEETFREVLVEAREAPDELAERRAEIGLGLALEQLGRYGEAIEHLESARAHNAVTVTSRPDVFGSLGRAYSGRGSHSDAVDLFQSCLDQLRAADPVDRALELRFAVNLSCALTDSSRFDEAREVLDATMQHESEYDPLSRAQVSWSQARIESMQGDPTAATSSMRRAISLLEATEDTHELAVAHLHVSQILVLENRTDEARPHLAQAERKLLELGTDRRNLGALRTQQAHRAVLRERADDAEALAREALDYLAEHAIDHGSAWHALGRAQALRGDLAGATASFANAVEQLRLGGEWREAAVVYRAWARALQSAGRDNDALDLLEQATVLTIKNTRDR